MPNYSTVKAAACLLFVLSFLFSACVKDNCKKQHTYTYYVPVYKTKNEVRANIKSNAPRTVENPGKIYVLGNTLFLNEIDKGIHVIDNTDPSHPRNIAFVDIPGNLDIAVKGTTLYADLYTDLVTLDIGNPADVKVKKIIDNLFPYRAYGNGFVNDQHKIIIDWVQKDTTVTENCEDNISAWIEADFYLPPGTFGNSAAAASPVGKGGSMARFTILGSRLYTVSSTDLDVFNITNAADPQHANHISVGWNIETIYPFKNALFIGSQSGMFIYNVTNADAPSLTGQFSHVRSCDPVIADDEYAYVTLRSGTVCQGFTNELDIVKLGPGFTNPVIQKVYPMTNPHGLSRDGNLLFICDGRAGLKMYNAADVMNLQLLKTIDMEAYDVIAYANRALVVAKDGLYQYNYANPADVRLLSKIAVNKK